MRGFGIIHHTEKVGGRRKERTVWDRVCRSPDGALGEESIANTSTTANRCFARSATTRPFIGQRPQISFGITSMRFPKTLRCVSRFGRSSRFPPMQNKHVMAKKRANRTRASWTQSSSMTSSSHPMSVDIPRKGWHFFQPQAFGQLSHHRQPKDDMEPLEFVLPRVFPTPSMALDALESP